MAPTRHMLLHACDVSLAIFSKHFLIMHDLLYFVILREHKQGHDVFAMVAKKETFLSSSAMGDCLLALGKQEELEEFDHQDILKKDFAFV